MADFKITDGISTSSSYAYIPTGALITKAFKSSLYSSNAGSISVEYLVVAGGGGGGGSASQSIAGGGGGAGGYRTNAGTSGGGASAEPPISITSGQSYTVTVGTGGSGGTGFAVGATGTR